LPLLQRANSGIRADYGEGFVEEGVGTVLHLAGRVAFGVHAGDILELERAVEGDDEPSPSRTLEQESSLSRAILDIL
jgi:hypothetical protein